MDNNLSNKGRRLLSGPQRLILSESNDNDNVGSIRQEEVLRGQQKSMSIKRSSQTKINNYEVDIPTKRQSVSVDSLSTSSNSRGSLGVKNSFPYPVSMVHKEDSLTIPIPENLSHIFKVNGKVYRVIKEIGCGGSCKVFSVLNDQSNILALKCVSVVNHEKEGNLYENEISILLRLRGKPCIIQLIDYEIREDMIYILLECGDIDLRRYLQKQHTQKKEINENIIRLAFQEMLIAVDEIHKEHIIHSDLKPANFLYVKGRLKLIDFGISLTMHDDETSIIQNHMMGTINYISPESLTLSTEEGHIIRPSSDIWSLGCILYDMVYGELPWGSGEALHRMQRIVDSKYEIPFPAIKNTWLIDIMKACLQRDEKKRPPIEGEFGLLSHPFLKPQGSRGLVVYKQLVMQSSVMKEVLQKIHRYRSDRRWSIPEIFPFVAKELSTCSIRRERIDIQRILDNAERAFLGNSKN